VTPDEFDALFDGVTRSAFRYEGLPVYAVDEEDADLAAWREGLPVAERSVRTDPWLARIADQTINRGVDWCRVRYAPLPLSWYLRWEIADGYLESQAVGERILLTDQQMWSGPDFWLFDAGTPDARGVLQRFDEHGAPVAQELVTDRAVVQTLITAADALAEVAMPLNRWIVEHRDELHGAGVRG
jgi:hypothetical protein